MGLKPIPDKLFENQRSIFANYDIVDIIRGRAYITLYGLLAKPKSTLYESYIAGDDTADDMADGTEWRAQTFTVGNTGVNEDFYVHGCEFYMYGTGVNQIKIRAIIRAVDGSNLPTGKNLAYADFTIDPPTGSATAQWNRFTFANAVKLSASTQYALILHGSDGSNLFVWRYDNTDGSYTGGERITSTDSGGSWSAQSGDDFLFKILGNTKSSLGFHSENLNFGEAWKADGVGDVAYTQQIQQDMDIVIGENAIVQGTTFITMPFTPTSFGNNETLSFYWDLELLRDRGGTETSMGTGSTNATFIADDVVTQHLTMGTIDVTSNISFRPNDILRLRATLMFKTDDGASGGTGTDISVNFEDVVIRLPFKLDIEIQ